MNEGESPILRQTSGSFGEVPELLHPAELLSDSGSGYIACKSNF